ncbi:MAG: hypothetical protein ACOC2M_00205 [bacterium]
MKRTKFTNQKEHCEENQEEYKYDIQHEPIVLSKPLIDLFLKQDNPSNLIALYTFYYYTAKWQKTNQIKATTSYVAKGLNWSERTVKRYKAQLLDLKLIESIAVKDEKGQINNWYVKINFIWTKNQRAKNAPLDEKTRGPKNHPVDKWPTNALSNNIKNALSNGTIMSDLENSSKKSNGYITPNKFNEFWELYPKKTDKGKALTKWEQICRRGDKRPEWNTIKEAIQNQKETDRWADKRFIPNPATWLNQSRWLDDPKEMKSYNFDRDSSANKITNGSRVNGKTSASFKYKKSIKI